MLDKLIAELRDKIAESGEPLAIHCHSKGVYREEAGYAIASAFIDNALACIAGSVSIPDEKSIALHQLLIASARPKILTTIRDDVAKFVEEHYNDSGPSKS